MGGIERIPIDIIIHQYALRSITFADLGVQDHTGTKDSPNLAGKAESSTNRAIGPWRFRTAGSGAASRILEFRIAPFVAKMEGRGMQLHTLDLHFQGIPQAIAVYAIPHPKGVVLIDSGPGSG